MKLFRQKKEQAKVRREDAIPHLSKKFGVPESDMSATFERVKGWRGGKEEWADTFTITLKQPTDRPNLHHDMAQELRDVFRAQYGEFNPKAMRFYFGVTEDKAHTKSQNAKRPRAPLPEFSTADPS